MIFLLWLHANNLVSCLVNKFERDQNFTSKFERNKGKSGSRLAENQKLKEEGMEMEFVNIAENCWGFKQEIECPKGFSVVCYLYILKLACLCFLTLLCVATKK